MRVLLVEDNEYKAVAMKEFLLQGRPEWQFFWAQSMHAGVQALTSFDPELVLLDMNLPTYDARPGEPKPIEESLGGREVLRQLHRKKSKARVIVVTQYDIFGKDASAITRAEMSTQLASKYSCYLGTVYFRLNSESWRQDLGSLIDQLSTGKV